MLKPISLRNLYIARLVLIGMTQRNIAYYFNISGSRVGQLTHRVLKRVSHLYCPPPVKEGYSQEPRALNEFIIKHKFRAFEALVEYEKKYYPAQRMVIQETCNTIEEAIEVIKGLAVR